MAAATISCLSWKMCRNPRSELLLLLLLLLLLPTPPTVGCSIDSQMVCLSFGALQFMFKLGWGAGCGRVTEVFSVRSRRRGLP